MVDLRSGDVLGFLRFDDLVQEIFDVAVLPGVRFPEIAEASDLTTARSFALPQPNSAPARLESRRRGRGCRPRSRR